MSAHIEPQIISDDGKPKFVVLPVEQYRTLVRQSGQRETIPHAVARLVLTQDMSPVKAWREHLGLTQREVARRMGITQSAFAQFEKPEAKLRKSTRQKIADGLGILPEQLDF